MRTINAIGILDPDESRFVWLWGPTNIARQHHPTLLPNGHILLFDNGQSASQIIELDPLTNAVVWRYAPLTGFYSESAGSVQRLPNGNTLITESDPGVVFEVTPDGDTVWRYLNPLTTADGNRETIWRMTRFDPQELRFLDQLTPR
jgi:outer membrane protein assembly factor BamB